MHTMTHHGSPGHGEMVVLAELAKTMIADLPAHDAGRSARTIVTGTSMRATLIALAQGHELAEHDAPPAATLYVVNGRIRLQAGDREWPLEAGQLIPIPPQRHAVHADTDAAFLLTVALH
jgi:quercetin dioxygenase-like cupin family protein